MRRSRHGARTSLPSAGWRQRKNRCAAIGLVTRPRGALPCPVRGLHSFADIVSWNVIARAGTVPVRGRGWRTLAVRSLVPPPRICRARNLSTTRNWMQCDDHVKPRNESGIRLDSEMDPKLRITPAGGRFLRREEPMRAVHKSRAGKFRYETAMIAGVSRRLAAHASKEPS